MSNIDGALHALLNYQQADEDGIMVLTSREAIHVVVDYIDELNTRSNWISVSEEIEALKDQLHNGIKYDEENNQYILVWTERQITKAKEKAEELSAKLKEAGVFAPSPPGESDE